MHAPPEPRVVLAAPTVADGAEFLRLMRESERLHRPWVYPPASPEEFAVLVRRQERDDFASYLFRRVEDDAIVGYANLSNIIRGAFQSAFLGYAAAAPHAGQGYMTEGIRLVLDAAFETLGLHRVEANIQPANGPSLALARRVGFSHEGFSPRYLRIGGRWCDHERWAITSESWRELAAAEAPAGRGRAAPGARRWRVIAHPSRR